MVNSSGPATLLFEVTDYDVFAFDSKLDSLVMEYRLLSGPNDWIPTTTQTIEDLLSADTEEPLTIFTLDPTNLMDGEYAVRVLAYGGSRVSYSNEVNGLVDRVRPAVLGIPSPGDGILALGDEVSITFTEDIQQGLHGEVVSLIQGSAVNATITYSKDGVVAAFTEEEFLEHVGDSLALEVTHVVDMAGNAMEEEQVQWPFRLDVSLFELSEVALEQTHFVVSQVTDEEVGVIYKDFDVDTRQVDSITFEYRETLSNEWQTFGSVDKAHLVQLTADGLNPQDTMAWSTAFLADGDYVIRALVHGLANQQKESNNTLAITLDRTSPELTAVFPSDTVFTFGDKVGFEFGESLDCDRGFVYTVTSGLGETNGNTGKLLNLSTPNCGSGKSILFGPNNEVLHEEIGKTITIRLEEAYDVYGNPVTPVVYSFVVGDFALETSPVSILSPFEEFVINETSNSLPITIGEYDFTGANYALDSVIVQFAKTFENEWKTVWHGTSDLLRKHYIEQGGQSFDLSWDLSDQIEDGLYSIRAVAFGNGGVAKFSTAVLGEIDREGPGLDDIDVHDDGEITITLSELLSEDLSGATIEVKQMVNGFSTEESGRVSATQAALSSYSTISSEYYKVEAKDKQLSVKFANVMMNEFGDQEVELFISGVKDKNGNLIDEEIYTTMVVPARYDSTGTNLGGSYNGTGGIDVSWYYSGLIASEGFQLERLYETVFEPVATFEELVEASAYKHIDNFNYRGDIYYRLKYTGTEDVYSKIIGVSLSDELDMIPIATVYPNPTTDRSRIRFRLLSRDFEHGLEVRVYSESGILLKEQAYGQEEIGQTVFTLDFSNELSAGIYYIEIVQGAHTSIERVIIK